MKKVKLCRLGFFNHKVDFQRVAEWESRYFNIIDISRKADINVDHFKNDYVYPTKHIAADMGAVGPGIDLLVAIVDQPLERTFYMHRIDSKSAVVSVFPVFDVLTAANIPIENFIIRCIYEMIVFLYEGGGRIEPGVYGVPHHETRGCIFDMNVFVSQIIHSSDKPKICDECIARLRRRTLPDDFIDIITKELRRIRKPLYYRIEARVRKHPIASLAIASALAISLNIVASFIYDLLL